MTSLMQSRALLLPLLLASLAGCAAAPSLDIEGEPTFDGLYPVSNAIADGVWVRPDIDLSGYTKLMPQSAGVRYRPVKEVRSTTAMSRNDAFPISESNRARIQEIFRDAFDLELARVDGFEIADAPGPDVLLVRGALIDVVSSVPPQPIGRGDIYISSVGEATLLIELLDAQSGAVLVRAIDRRAAQPIGDQMIWSSPASNIGEVRRLASAWARWVRSGIESLAANELIGAGGVSGSARD